MTSPIERARKFCSGWSGVTLLPPEPASDGSVLLWYSDFLVKFFRDGKFQVSSRSPFFSEDLKERIVRLADSTNESEGE